MLRQLHWLPVPTTSDLQTGVPKALFIVTQLNSTRRRVELSCVALDTLYDARRRSLTGVERHAASQCYAGQFVVYNTHSAAIVQ